MASNAPIQYRERTGSIRTVGLAIGKFLIVVLVLAAAGGTIGLVQAIVAFRPPIFAEIGVFALQGASIGICLAVTLGLILYYFVLAHKINVREFSFIYLICLLVGEVSALLGAFLSAAITPMVLIVACFCLRLEHTQHHG